jgi:hypothetical protein
MKNKHEIEYPECEHHFACVQIEGFCGCSKCKHLKLDTSGSHVRDYFERSKGIIIPYNYSVVFRNDVVLFEVIP